MTRKLFAALDVYQDDDAHSAAMNMAIDEALLDYAIVPSIRFYRWQSPALSFGYFGKFDDVANYVADLVRRWTGGGIVFHGNDLTYSIVIPAGDPAFAESSMAIYEKIHRALCEAFIANGVCAELAILAALESHRNPAYGTLAESQCHKLSSAIGRRDRHCFANPVHADVMIDGRKIAGAAQRRTRLGLLQQGSIQCSDLADGLAYRFACKLSPEPQPRSLSEGIRSRARQIAASKYATDTWLRKR